MDLVITQFGASLRIRDGLFSVKHKDGISTVPAGQVKTLTLHRGVTLSTDALFAALDMGIDVLLADRRGDPLGRLWNHRFGSISTIRKNQLAFSRSPAALPWITGLLDRKVEGQILLLQAIAPDRDYAKAIAEAIRKMEETRIQLTLVKGVSVHETGPRLRALEGYASRLYFETVNHCLPDQYRFDRRSKHPAMDMANSLLNYAYGMLYGRLESALLRAGIDPSIGVLHRDEYNRPVLTYDCIEPFRVWADWVVFHLCRGQVIFREFFDTDNGGWWLNDQGKRILIQSFTDFFEEVIPFEGLDRSRFVHLDLFAQRLAQQFKNFETDGAD